MKRSMWGITLLAAATGLWSCNGDPTGDLREGETIQADPSSVFVQQGETKFVTVELVDGQGNQLATDFTAHDATPGITVAEDPTFLATTIGTRLPTQERFVVTGVTPSVNSFVVSAGDTSLTVEVQVLPTSFGATLSPTAPALNQAVTITAPAGFSFGPAAGVTIGADPGFVVDRAVDGTSVSFIPRPGFAASTQVPVVSDTRSSLFPSIPLEIPTVDSLIVPAAAAVPGTASTGTAPAIPTPASGLATVFFDLPDFLATPDHFYRLDVAEAGDYTISVDWSVGADVDVFLCVNDASCAAADFTAATANKPESATFTLPVGTTYIGVEDFGPLADPPGATANGGVITITVTHLAA